MNAIARVAIKLDELVVLGGLSADTGAGNDGSSRFEVGCEIELRVCDGLTGGYEGELGEAIHDSLLRGLEVLGGIEVLDLGTVLEAQAGGIDERDRGDAGDVAGEIRPEFGDGGAECGDDSETCYRDATHEMSRRVCRRTCDYSACDSG